MEFESYIRDGLKKIADSANLNTDVNAGAPFLKKVKSFKSLYFKVLPVAAILTILAIISILVETGGSSSHQSLVRTSSTISGSTTTSGTNGTSSSSIQSTSTTSGANVNTTTSTSGVTTTSTVSNPDLPGSTFAQDAASVPPSTNSEFSGIACPAALTCYMIGLYNPSGSPNLRIPQIFKTLDGGKSWSPLNVPSGTYSLNSITCPTSSSCWAVGNYAILYSDNGGQSWVNQFPSSSSGVVFEAISCINSMECVTVGWTSGASDSEIDFTTNAGNSWVKMPNPTQGSGNVSGALMGTIACQSLTSCILGGAEQPQAGTINHQIPPGVIIQTSDGGSNWNVLTTLGGSSLPAINSLSCPSNQQCVATGVQSASGSSILGSFIITTTGGQTWEKVSTPILTTVANTVVCNSATYCLASNTSSSSSSAQILVSKDGGQTWSTIGSVGANGFEVTKIAFDPGGVAWIVGNETSGGVNSYVAESFSNLT